MPKRYRLISMCWGSILGGFWKRRAEPELKGESGMAQSCLEAWGAASSAKSVLPASMPLCAPPTSPNLTQPEPRDASVTLSWHADTGLHSAATSCNYILTCFMSILPLD